MESTRITTESYLFEPYEWSIIHLLHNIKEKFINKIIERWTARIKEDQEDCNVLRQNLVSAFFNLDSMMDEKLRRNTNYAGTFSEINRIFELPYSIYEYKVWNRIGSKNKECFLNFLGQNGYLLFNSYYYEVLDAYGEKNLIPIIPGYRPDDPTHFYKAQSYLIKNKLPFRFYDLDRIVTYANQLLPCIAGTTPYYFKFVSESNSGDRRKVSFCVNNFIGDLSLLHKLEDFIQGHISALVTIMKEKGRKDPLGAFVLSSLIPEAFDREDSRIIEEIINKKMEFRMIPDLHKKPLIPASGIWTHLDFDGQFHFETFKDEIIDAINSFISNDTKNSFVFFSSRSKCENGVKTFVTSISLNIDGIYKIMFKLFPSGPWVDRSLVTYQKTSESVDIDKIKSLCIFLNKLFGLAGYGKLKEVEFPLITQVFHLMLPELEYNFNKKRIEDLDQYIKCIDIDNYYSLMVITALEKRKIHTKLFFELVKLIKREIRGEQLPDGENSVLANVQKEWIRDQNEEWYSAKNTTKTKGKTGSDLYEKTVEIKKELANIFKNKKIRAILIVKKRKIYIPRKPSTSNLLEYKKILPWEDFWKIYMSYPSYWLFERVNQILTKDILNIDSFSKDNLSSSYSHGYLSKRKRDSPLMCVTLGREKKNDIKFIRALTFLGMHVSEWKIDQEKKFIKIHYSERDGSEPYETDDLLEVYRRYVLSEMQIPLKIESLNRIFGPYRDKFNLSSIKISKKKNLDIVHEIEVDNKSKIDMSWEPIDTLQLELCCLNGESIMEGWKSRYDFYCDKLDEIKDNKANYVHEMEKSTKDKKISFTYYYERAESGKKLPPVIPRNFNALTNLLKDLIENARVIEIDRKTRDQKSLIRETQQQLLPKPLTEFPGYCISWRCLPAEEVGGDYLDIVNIDDNEIAIAIGDVQGHGYAAAILMSNLLGFFRAYANERIAPASLADKIDKLITKYAKVGQFITFFNCKIDRGANEILYYNAGHLNPIIVNKQGDVRELKSMGLPLGISLALIPPSLTTNKMNPLEELPIYKENKITLRQGDILVLYTDGITETRNRKNQEYGLDRFKQLCIDNRTSSAEKLINEIILDIKTFMGEKNQTDDIAAIVIKKI